MCAMTVKLYLIRYSGVNSALFESIGDNKHVSVLQDEFHSSLVK